MSVKFDGGSRRVARYPLPWVPEASLAQFPVAVNLSASVNSSSITDLELL